MSETIDQRVVEMRFENRQFEQGANESISTLKKLKENLDFEGTTKSLEQVSNSVKHFDMSPMAGAIETVHAKFSAFEVMAYTAISRLTNAAIDAGKNLVKSFSVDQLSVGWEKYGEKTRSVATIMSATGKSIDEVSESLDKLNWFTDETSYRLDDMTNNIGKFTAQGIELDTAVTAMEGISTWASLSGQGVNEASRAMYNLAQAIGVGSVKLMDWRSIENANMGTKEFKEQALEAAAAIGELSKSVDKTGEVIYKTASGTEVSAKNFSSTLSEGWFTSEALLNTLNNYGGYADKIFEVYNSLPDNMSKLTSEIITDLETLNKELTESGEVSDQSILDLGYTRDLIPVMRELAGQVGGLGSKAFRAAQEAKTFREALDSVKEAVGTGWMKTADLVFGNYEEVRVLWTDLANGLYDIFAEGGNQRNDLLSSWRELGGRDDFIEGLYNSFEALSQIIETVKKAFRDIFPAMDAERLVEITKRFKEFTESLLLTEDRIEKIRSILLPIFKTFDSLKRVLSSVVLIIKSVFSSLKTAFDNIFGIDRAAIGFVETISRLADNFALFSEKIAEFIQRHSGKITKFFTGLFAVIDILANTLRSIASVFKYFFNTIVESFKGIDISISGGSGSLLKFILNLRDSINEGNLFGKAIEKAKEYIDKFGKGLDILVGWFNKLKDVAITVKDSIVSFVAKVGEKFSTKGIEKFHGLLGSVNEILTSAIATIIKFKNAVVNAFTAIDKKTGKSKFITILETIFNLVGKVAKAIVNLGKKIFGSLFENFSLDRLLEIIKALSAGGIAVGVTKFVKSFKESVEVLKGFKDSFVGIFSEVKNVLAEYQKQIKARTILKIAEAIGILALSLLVVSSIPADKLDNAIGGITVLFVELAGTMALLTKFGDIKGRKIGMTMLEMSAAVLILASAMKTIGSMSSDEIERGLVGVLGLITMLTTAMVALGRFQKGATKGASTLILMAGAIRLLVKPCVELSRLSWEELEKGLLSIGILVAELSAAMILLGHNQKRATKGASTLILMAGAIRMLVSPIKTLSSLSWEELEKGLLSVGILIAELSAALIVIGRNQKRAVRGATSMVILAASLEILADVCKKLGDIDSNALQQGLAAIGAILLELAAFAVITQGSKKMVSTGTGIVLVASSLQILVGVVKKLGEMNFKALAQGMIAMTVALGVLTASLKILGSPSVLAGAAALTLLTGSIAILTPVLAILGAMPIENIGKALLMLAGTFTILGVAGAVLGPMAKSLLAVSASIVVLGAGVALLGVGLLAAGAGLSALAIGITALGGAVVGGAALIVKAIGAIITGIIDIIPDVIRSLGGIIKAICELVIESVPAIAEAAIVLITSLVDVIVECVPQIVDGLLILVKEALKSLVEHGPEIIDKAIDFLIIVIDGIANRLPDIFGALGRLVSKIFEALIAAFNELDVDILLKGITAFGAVALLMNALKAAGTSAAAAMKGVLVVGAVVTEIGVILAAIGGLAQIPGLKWLIEEGGNFLQLIGTALGQFVGGIIGGIGKGISAALPQIGTDLSVFMTNLKPFIDGAKEITPEMLDGVGALVDIIFLLTAAELLDGIVSFFTGSSSITRFAEEIVPLGQAISAFSKEIKNVDNAAVEAAANSARLLAEVERSLVNHGGVVSFFTGDNDIGEFAEKLPQLGFAIKAFADNVNGIDTGSVESAANAALALANLEQNLPNHGGVVGWITGEEDMAGFAENLPKLGFAIKAFADSIHGVAASEVEAAANSGKALAVMASELPNSGGLVEFFTGDNDISEFAEKLPKFGAAMKEFAEALGDGIDGDLVSSAANAGKSIAEMAATLPNEGGIVSWFTGDNDLESFSKNLPIFGEGMKKFSDAITADGGINSDLIASAANAGKSIAEMTATLPNEGGIISWFTGDNDIVKFSENLPKFGEAMKHFSDAITADGGIDSDLVTAAANAGKSVSEMVATLPNEGGIVSWFTGDVDMNKFSTSLPLFGAAVAEFSEQVAGKVSTEAIDAAINVGKAMVELQNTLPNTGGVVSWFTGDNDLETFGANLVSFGQSFQSYSLKMQLVNTDVVKKTTDAAQSLVTLQETLPDIGGWFDSSYTIADFGDDLADFGEYFKNFYDEIQNINAQTIASVTDEISKLVDIASATRNLSTEKMEYFVDWLREIADNGINKFIDAFTNAEDRIIAAAVEMINDFIAGLSSMTGNVGTKMKDICDSAIKAIDDKLGEFKDAGNQIGLKVMAGILAKDGTIKETFKFILNGVKKLISDEYYGQFKETGSEIFEKFVDGITSKHEASDIAFSNLIASGIIKIKEKYEDFYSAGRYLVQGLVSGITAGKKDVSDVVAKMAKEAIKSAEEALDIHSPSKEFWKIGKLAVQGFTEGTNDNIKISNKVVTKEFAKLVTGVSKQIDKIFGKSIDVLTDKSKTERLETFAKVIGNVGNKLYSQTDAFKDSSKTLKEYNDQLKKLDEEEKKLEASLKSTKTVNRGSISNRLKEIEEERKKINEEIKDEQFKMVEDSKKAFVDFYDSVKSSVEDSVDFFKSFDDAITSVNDSIKEQEEYIKEISNTISNSLNLLSGLGSELTTINDLYSSIGGSISSKLTLSANSSSDEESVDNAYDFISGIESQIAKAQEWSENLVKLASRGLNRELFDQLAEMGAEDSAAYIQSFLSLTDEQFANINERFANAFTAPDDIAATIANAYDQIYQVTETEKQEAAASLLDNFKSQKQTLLEWEDNLKSLVERGLSEDIFKELVAMGPENGKQYIQAFVAMTQDQLKEANKLYLESLTMPDEIAKELGEAYTKSGEKSASAAQALLTNLKEQAVNYKEWGENMSVLTSRGLSEELMKQLSTMGPEKSAEYVKAFLEMTDAEIGEVNEAFAETLSLPGEVANTVVASYAMVGINSADGFIGGLTDADKIKEAEEAGKLVGDTALEATKKKLKIKSPSKAFAKLGKFADEGFVEGIANNAASIGNTIAQTFTISPALESSLISKYRSVGEQCVAAFRTAVESIESERAEYETLGNQITSGITSGIQNGNKNATSAATSLATNVVKATKNTLKIKSPSKVFEEIGMYTVQGFAGGLERYSGLVADSALTVESTVINTLSQAISRVAEMVDENMDTAPVIRPVLDLSNVESNTARLNTMFTRSQALSVDASIRATNADKYGEDGENASSTGNTYTFTQNNYSPKALSRIEIYRQTKNQFSAMKEALR